MIAADTSTWIAYLQGDVGKDVEVLDRALLGSQVQIPPAVLTEVLSDPKLPVIALERFVALPLLETEPGYWHRAGALRARVLATKRKARLGDVLIAQSCIDAGIPLLTRDRDFRIFAQAAELALVTFG